MQKIGASQEIDSGETPSLFGFLKMDKRLSVLDLLKSFNN